MAEKCEDGETRSAGGSSEALFGEIIEEEIRRAMEDMDGAGPEEQARLIDTIDLVNRLEKIDAAKNYPANDLGGARLFAEMFKDECRYSPTVKDWMWFDGVKWVRDPEGMKARSRCKALADALLRYVMDRSPLEGEEAKKSYLKYVYNFFSSRIRNTVVNDARDINSFKNEDLDADDFTINLMDCTLDLRSDPPACREHNPDDLISKSANVVYDPAAPCPLWEKTLDEIMEGDAAKIRYLQKLLGLCLTGDTREEQMYFLYGSTSRNGKSTVTETILYILGDYGQTINPETLAIKTNKDSRTASPDLAKLAGARLVIASEPPKRMLFDASLAKTLTGRDRIAARYLHENEFSFTPKFKLIFNTNYLPSINDPTVFLSGRIKVIEFNRHFTEEEQDKTLKDKLREEASGILNWMIEGYRMYKREGLKPPAAVKDATSEYAADSDKLGKFISECLVKDPDARCEAGVVYSDYEKWTQDNGLGTESKSNFFNDLKTKGLFKASATIGGKTVKNVIVGYARVENTFHPAAPDEDNPFEYEQEELPFD